MRHILGRIYTKLPTPFRDTLILIFFGLFKIRLLFFCTPRVVHLDEHHCAIRIPLNWRTRNHLGSMYFGVLACGADCAAGLMAMKLIMLSGERINLVFKDFHAEFLKRPMNDVVFTCDQGTQIKDLIQRVRSSEERENLAVQVVATEPTQFGSEPVARFTLTLSLKARR